MILAPAPGLLRKWRAWFMTNGRTILLLAEGFTETDRRSFESRAAAVAHTILTTEPFASEGVTVETKFVPSNERTVDGAWGDTRYQLRVAADNTGIRSGGQTLIRLNEDRGDARWVVIIANSNRSAGSVWSGACFASGLPARLPGTVLHELGHLIGGLADEYGSQSRDYAGQHPAPNFTSLDDVKWQHLVTAGLLPPPTPKAGLYRNLGRPLPRSRMMDSREPFSPVDVITLRAAIRAGNLRTDINCDGAVDFTDLNTVLSNMGRVGDNIPGDVNGDGKVDFADLNAVMTDFGRDMGDEH